MSIRFRGSLVVAFACAWLARGVVAQPLSLDRALDIARARSQAVVAQDAAATAARELAVAAGQLPDPTITVGINNLPVTGPEKFSVTDDFMTMRSIGVMQEFTREGKRKARSARYEREAESAEAGKQLALSNVSRDTALAWLDRYYQEAIGTMLRRQRAEAKLAVDAADAAYRASRGSQADAIMARAAVGMIEDRIAQNEREVLSAKTMLARWVGAAAEDPLSAPPSMSTPPLDTVELDAGMAHHPAIAVLTKQEEVAQAEAEMARAAKLTDWSLALMYSQRGPAYSNMVSINVSIPLQWDQPNRQDREVAAKLALADQARAQREEMVRDHAAEVRVMWQEWQSYRERLGRYDATLIPLASELTRAAATAYRSGTGPLAAVLDARRSEIDTGIERAKLELDAARAWARLRYLLPSDHATRAARG
jgi:outer membrane protein TolC